MSIQFFSKKFFNFISLPVFLFLSIFEINILNKEIKAENNSLPATEKDLFLYKGMGASYLCIASKAGIEFPKAVGVASATYVQVIEGKHGGLIKNLGNKKLDREKYHVTQGGIVVVNRQMMGQGLSYNPELYPNYQ